MGFKIKKYTFTLEEVVFIHISLENKITENDLTGILDILQEYLDDGCPFGFMVDSTKCTDVPFVTGGNTIIHWMKKNKQKIPNCLLGSVILTQNMIIRNILSFVFSVRKPMSPNKVTKNINKGIEFLSQNICPRITELEIFRTQNNTVST